MGNFFKCPDCGRKINKNLSVRVFEQGKSFEVCIECYEDIHFERTQIWKECLKNMKCSNALISVK